MKYVSHAKFSNGRGLEFTGSIKDVLATEKPVIELPKEFVLKSTFVEDKQAFQLREMESVRKDQICMLTLHLHSSKMAEDLHLLQGFLKKMGMLSHFSSLLFQQHWYETLQSKPFRCKDQLQWEDSRQNRDSSFRLLITKPSCYTHLCSCIRFAYHF